MADDQEKQSLRKQVEILTIQKDTFSKQLDKLRKELAIERAEARKNQIKLLDEIRAKDIEIKATKRFLEKKETTLRDGLRDEFSALQIEKERLEEVSKELDSKRNMIDALIRARKSEFEEKLRSGEALFERAKEDFKKENHALNSEISKSREELASVNEKFANEKNILQNLISQKEKEIEALTAGANKKETEIQMLTGRTAKLEKENFQIKNNASTLEKDFSLKDSNYKTLISQKDNEINEINKNLKKLAKDLQNLMQEKQKISDNLQEKEKKLQNTFSQLEILEGRNKNDKKTLDISVRKLLKAKEEVKKLSALKGKNIELLKQIETLKSENESLEGENKKHAMQTSALQKLITENDNTTKINRQQLNELTGILATKEKIIKNFEIANSKNNEEILELNNTILELKKVNAKMKENIFSLEKEFSAKETEYKNIISQKNSETEKTNQQLQQNISEITEKENQIDELSKTLDDLKNANSEAAEETKNLNLKLKDKMAETVKLNSALHDIKEINQVLENNSKKNLAELRKKEDVSKQLERQIEESSKLKKENAGLENQNRKMEATVHSLESEKKELIEKNALLQLKLQAPPEKIKPSTRLKKKFKCSECGKIIFGSEAVCPHCGAKFD